MDEGDHSEGNALSPAVIERAKELARSLPLNWEISVGAPELKLVQTVTTTGERTSVQ
jgi:hypothetical protein